MSGLRFVTADEFKALCGPGKAAVVAFVATWNRRCQGFAVDYQALAAQWAAALPVVCVDVDESSALAARFEICSVPTTLLMRDGQVVCREAGLALAPIGACLASGRAQAPG
jgi:thiol-disulfide isomerase/thioredoxin